jgi:predicted ester cyclase
MKSIKSILTLFWVLCAFAIFAQKPVFGDNYRDDSDRNGSRRFAQRCDDPFAERLFTRDFTGLSNINFQYLDKELRSYTKSRCLSVGQIRRLAHLLPTDREKFDYLTFSLSHVYYKDVPNYAITSTVLTNQDARYAYYRFLVREGINADQNAEAYVADKGFNPSMFITPQYDRFGNPFPNELNNRRINNSDTYYNNNDGFNHSYGKEYKRSDNDIDDTRTNRDRNNNNTYDNNNRLGSISGYRDMTYREFEALKDRVKQNTFDKGKLDIAKSLTMENTFSSSQIADIARIINEDNYRLEFAKFAYDYVYDRVNYFTVNEAFTSDKTRKELTQYIKNRK